MTLKIIDNWKEAVSLGEWILKQLRDGKQESDEFKAVMKVYGRQRFEDAYRKALRAEKDLLKKGKP